jgi:hypothetical protein
MFAIAFGIFVFVALIVAGSRAIATLDRLAAARRPARQPVAYTGPLYNSHGREIRA